MSGIKIIKNWIIYEDSVVTKNILGSSVAVGNHVCIIEDISKYYKKIKVDFCTKNLSFKNIWY